MEEDMIISGGVRYRPEDAKRLKLQADTPSGAATLVADANPDQPEPTDPDPAKVEPVPEVEVKRAGTANKARTAQDKGGV